MNTYSSPRGCKILAVFSLLVGIGGLVRAFDGHVDSLIIALFQLPAAYGLWTGVFWGWYAGLAAYGIGGIRGVWELQMNLLAGVISILFAILIIGYIYSKRSYFLNGEDPTVTMETITDLVK